MKVGKEQSLRVAVGDLLDVASRARCLLEGTRSLSHTVLFDETNAQPTPQDAGPIPVRRPSGRYPAPLYGSQPIG
jgi:hypothetical protein